MPEAEFEDIAKGVLTVDFDAGTQVLATRGGEGEAGIHGCLVVGGGFGLNQLAGEGDEARLLAAGAGQQSAHGNLRVR